MNNIQQYYPVRVLFNKVSKLFETICGYEDIKHNIQSGLYNKIRVFDTSSPITNIAGINHRFLENNQKVSEIEISESYCQFLWCLCYTMIIFIDEYILRPRHKIVTPLNEKRVDIACEVFNTGMKLFEVGILHKDFYTIPNACDIKADDVSTTNHIYKYALCYIIFHEYAHFELNHLEKISYHFDDEYDADSYAFFNMCHKTYSNQDKMSKYLGCIVGLGSLFFAGNTLKGDLSHPDNDDRLNKLIVLMRNQDITSIEQCYHWAVALYKIWALYYELECPNILITNTISIDEYYNEFYKSFKLNRQ